MSNLGNFVQCRFVTPLAIGATEMTLYAADAPYNLPPAGGGLLVLCDSPGNPSFIEVISYTSRTGLNLSGVVRGLEGTTARAWSGFAYCFQSMLAGDYAADMNAKENTITAGTAAQMWLGNKTWASVLSQVQGTLLTGLSLAAGTAISATDTVLSGLGKLQKQITDAATNLAGNVRSTVLTSYIVGTNNALAATDTVLGAFGKVQAQITGLATSKLDVTANAVSASKLQTARTIGGVSFDGSANISLPGVNVAGTQATTGNAATATALQTARNINGVPFNGTANVVIPAGPPGSVVEGGRFYDFHFDADLTQDYDVRFEVGDAPAGVSGSGILTIHSGGVNFLGNGTLTGNGSGLTSLNAANLASGIVPDARLSGTYTGVNITGNAATATKLATVRTINGVAFDGTANISIAVGETGRLPLTGGAVSGKTSFTKTDQTDHSTAAVEIAAQSGAAYIGFHRHGVFGGLFGVDTGNNFYGNAGLTMAGNITAYSDMRLKTDIEVISDALNKVCNLRGVTYTRIEGNERQTGVIAQEVQAVLPEAVKIGEDEDQTLSVAYGNLVGLLIEAIKELNQTVTELRTEVNTLKGGV